ncbi:hypothetical protein ACHAWF_007729 [Thalassiosira exigua]
MLEVYVDDFIQMAQTNEEAQLRYCSRAILHAIHSVFPPPEISGHSGEDPISLKKKLAGEGLWEARKEILGWMIDGATRSRRPSWPSSRPSSAAKWFLFGPINQVLQIEPVYVVWEKCPAARRALEDWGQLIRESMREPTHVNELVPGEADYKGTLDASGEGAGGVWLPANKELAPIVWRLKWPQEVVDRLVTGDNPDGDIDTNSDLEMAAEVLGWLVL